MVVYTGEVLEYPELIEVICEGCMGSIGHLTLGEIMGLTVGQFEKILCFECEGSVWVDVLPMQLMCEGENPDFIVVENEAKMSNPQEFPFAADKWVSVDWGANAFACPVLHKSTATGTDTKNERPW